jgi:hypothetical protein
VTANDDNVWLGLADVPPVPERLLPAIEGRIRSARRKRLLGSGFALAACVLLTAGVLSYHMVERADGTVSAQAAVDNGAAEELQEIRSYLNGSDVDEEIGLYAIVDFEVR